ncbi:MAG TPA: hypothetical protein VKC51_05050, partial [Lacunisphaera sp.]|nr:hypothetical protein [Lacunisphaera sp.]
GRFDDRGKFRVNPAGEPARPAGSRLRLIACRQPWERPAEIAVSFSRHAGNAHHQALGAP